MNYEKLQKEIITLMMKGKGDTINWNVVNDEINDKPKEVHITTNGFLLHVIPYCFWFIDVKKFTKTPLNTQSILPKNLDNYESVKFNGIIEKKGKNLITELSTENYKTYIDINLLTKYYDINRLTFHISKNPLKPVIFTEYGNEIAGVIMPVRI